MTILHLKKKKKLLSLSIKRETIMVTFTLSLLSCLLEMHLLNKLRDHLYCNLTRCNAKASYHTRLINGTNLLHEQYDFQFFTALR